MKRKKRGKRGQGMLEYILILAVIVIGVVAVGSSIISNKDGGLKSKMEQVLNTGFSKMNQTIQNAQTTE